MPRFTIKPPPRWPAGARAIPNREVHVVYRLIAEAPFTVSFPSLIYRVEWWRDRHINTLNLVDLATKGTREIIRYADPDGDFLGYGSPREIYTAGVDVIRPSVLDTVLTRLVTESRAEILTGAHCRVTFRGRNGEFLK